MGRTTAEVELTKEELEVIAAVLGKMTPAIIREMARVSYGPDTKVSITAAYNLYTFAEEFLEREHGMEMNRSSEVPEIRKVSKAISRRVNGDDSDGF